MSRYKAFKKRQENASPYANEAICKRCKHGEWVYSGAFCNGFGRPRRISYKSWDTDKVGYCTQFYPKGADDE